MDTPKKEPRLDSVLESLHETLAKELLARIKTGEASAAELTAASRFLKDNGIDASFKQSEPLKELAKNLPFQDPERLVGSRLY